MQEYNHEAYTKGIGIYLKDIKGSEYKWKKESNWVYQKNM
jgi:hypothetical protein